MNLSTLTDETLDLENVAVAKAEREILAKALHHLKETERRRLYSKYKYESLIDYAVKRMGYTEDQAWRRINAMRLLKELPQIESKIVSGALSLTHLNQAAGLFRQEKKAQVYRATNEKLELLSKIEHQSKRVAEKTLESASLLKPLLVEFADLNSRKPVELEQFSPEMQKKIKRLMEVRAHTSGKDVISVLVQAVDLALEKWDPMVKAACPAPARKSSSVVNTERYSNLTAQRYVPAQLRKEVFARDEANCQNCGSRRLLQIDHILPFSKGGKTELSNLRLLCRSCNQRHAINSYGQLKMNNYLREPSRLYSA